MLYLRNTTGFAIVDVMFGVSMILMFVGLNPFCKTLVAGSRSCRLRADDEPVKTNN